MSVLNAKAGAYEDESKIKKVDEFNEAYRLKEEGDVINWFEITTKEGCFSINDKFGEVMENKAGARYMKRTLALIFLKIKLKSKNSKDKDKAKDNGKSRNIDLGNPEMKKFLYGISVKRLISMAGTMGPGMQFTKKQVLDINKKLNKIKK